ncbi:MAG TPA: pseudouridine-5'-phosphate glycosidase [Gemmatimonadaceae bacterium]|nr:pseudouridine-5'-phosphate glycosidase [Gemmatimonadaceae bacterium]
MALRDGRPVVALESSVLAQGLPDPANRDAAERMASAVRKAGALPAVTAVLRGVPALGVTPDELERLLRRVGVHKVAARDLPACVAEGADGATTVSAALAIARHAGVTVFATGGIGGVHRGAAFDESADLGALGRTSMVVVCAGAKSILDLPATFERLETYGVTVIGYRTDEFPGFFTAKTGLRVPVRIERVAAIAESFRAARALGLPGATLVVQPPPAAAALDAVVVERAVLAAMESAERAGVTGAGVTPFLLSEVERQTGGRSLGANLALLEENASLAGRIAVELCGRAEH